MPVYKILCSLNWDKGFALLAAESKEAAEALFYDYCPGTSIDWCELVPGLTYDSSKCKPDVCRAGTLEPVPGVICHEWFPDN